MLRNHTRLLLLLFVASALLTATGWADPVVITYSGVATGAEPGGSAPWLTATFEQGSAANQVRLTLSASDLADGEFVTSWYFNLNPGLNLHHLSISQTGGGPDAGIHQSQDRYRAGDSGRFDIRFDFSSSGRGPGRFDSSDQVVLVLTYEGGSLTPQDFATVSASQGGQISRYAIAHIQGIDGGRCKDLSSKVYGEPSHSVPEPGALLLLGTGLLCLGLLRRRRS